MIPIYRALATNKTLRNVVIAAAVVSVLGPIVAIVALVSTIAGHGASTAAMNDSAAPEPCKPTAQTETRTEPEGSWAMPIAEGDYTIGASFGESGPHWVNLHMGQDFVAATGTPVMAPTSGTVATAGIGTESAWAGRYVQIRHDGGVIGLYAHLSATTVHFGSEVAAGEVIGRVGSTGNSTGPHLHVETSQNGNPIDPMTLFNGKSQTPPDDDDCATGGGDGELLVAELPQLARDNIAQVRSIHENACPDIPIAWAAAMAMAESSWDPTAWADDRNGGTSGLLQLNRENWATYHGNTDGWPADQRPARGSPPTTLEHTWRAGLEMICANLAWVDDQIERNSWTVDPLEAAAVCHNAGCGRVPDWAETGALNTTTTNYLSKIHEFYAAYTGERAVNIRNCPPTGSNAEKGLTPDALLVLRCTADAFPELVSFGGVGDRPNNPGSAHPSGRAVDMMIPDWRTTTGNDLGWRAARFLKANAKDLGVDNVIFDQKIWSIGRDDEGWRSYSHPSGNSNPTLDHEDHIHVEVFGNRTG